MQVTIIGGGNGAFASAGHLALEGHAVMLLELQQFADNIASIRSDSSIAVSSEPYTGLPSGHGRLAGVTTDAATAMAHGDLVIVVTPSFGHATIAQTISRHVRSGQTILLAPGNLWGSLEFHQILATSGAPSDVTVGEAACLIYACRKTGGNSVTIRGYKHHLAIAVHPTSNPITFLNTVRQVYSDVVLAQSIVETGLCNVNPFYHTAILLHSAARVDWQEADFPFYLEGCSPGVARVIGAMDEERRSIARQVGIELEPLADMTRRWYEHDGANGTDLFNVIRTVPAYQRSRSPKGLNGRYLFEDLPYGLAPISDLGRVLGVPTPTIDAVVTLLSAFSDSALQIPKRTAGMFGLNQQLLRDLTRVLQGG